MEGAARTAERIAVVRKRAVAIIVFIVVVVYRESGVLIGCNGESKDRIGRSASKRVHRGRGSSKARPPVRHPHGISHPFIGQNTEQHALQQHTVKDVIDTLDNSVAPKLLESDFLSTVSSRD